MQRDDSRFVGKGFFFCLIIIVHRSLRCCLSNAALLFSIERLAKQAFCMCQMEKERGVFALIDE